MGKTKQTGNKMKIAVLFVCLILVFHSALAIKHYNFVWEYQGKSERHGTLINTRCKAGSETIKTRVRPDGNIHYDVTRSIGPVAFVNFTTIMDTSSETFTETAHWTFGASHLHQEHTLTTTTVAPQHLFPSDHELVYSAAAHNITSGSGAFKGAVGGIALSGQLRIADNSFIVIAAGEIWVP